MSVNHSETNFACSITNKITFEIFAYYENILNLTLMIGQSKPYLYYICPKAMIFSLVVKTEDSQPRGLGSNLAVD